MALVAVGCQAQSATSASGLSPEIVHRIQTEIRAKYGVPNSVSIAVGELKPGSVPDFDNVTVTFTGSKKTTLDFLLSKDRKTLAHLDKIDISQDLMSKIDMNARPKRGNSEAKVTIVNFDDFQCPFCSRMHSTLFPGLLQAYGDKVKIVYKDYPLVEIHPWAMHAAVDANCLAQQSNEAYWDFADYVHGNQKAIAGHNSEEAFTNLDNAVSAQATKYHLDVNKVQACTEKQDEATVRASMVEGDKIGVDSTPTLFINGERVSGALPESEMRAIIDRALADAGQQPSGTDAKK